MLKSHILAFNRGEYSDLLSKNGILRRMETRKIQWWIHTSTVQMLLPMVFDMENPPFSSLGTTFP